MESKEETSNLADLKMANEEHYRLKEISYHNSPAYIRMKNLYPVLKTCIEDCKNESPIA